MNSTVIQLKLGTFRLATTSGLMLISHSRKAQQISVETAGNNAHAIDATS